MNMRSSLPTFVSEQRVETILQDTVDAGFSSSLFPEASVTLKLAELHLIPSECCLAHFLSVAWRQDFLRPHQDPSSPPFALSYLVLPCSVPFPRGNSMIHPTKRGARLFSQSLLPTLWSLFCLYHSVTCVRIFMISLAHLPNLANSRTTAALSHGGCPWT